MVDHESRSKARDLIAKFAAGQLTNDEFDHEYPRSNDRAVRVVLERLWFFWDDLKTHRLEGTYQLDAGARELVNRCIQFLSSDLEYTGPAIGGTLLSDIRKSWNGLLGKPAPPENAEGVPPPSLSFLGESYRPYLENAL